MGHGALVELESAVELERIAALSRRQMWESAAPEAIVDCGIEVRRFGSLEATAFCDEPIERRLNEVRAAGEPGPIEPGDLAEAVEWMRAREVEYRVAVPDCGPGAGEAGAWLEERGYDRCGGRVTFVRDAAPPLPPLAAPPGIELFELTEEWEGEGFCALACEALKLPGMAEQLTIMLPSKDNWRCYTALPSGEELVAATGATMIDGDVAQLTVDATLPRARGRGCNRALVRRRLADAAAAGCRIVFAELDEDDPPSFAAASRNLAALGFEQAARTSFWQRPALAHLAAGDSRK